MNAVAVIDSTSAGYPMIGRRANTGRMVEINPVAGMKMMYTSGCPKNQNRCCHSRLSPPSAALKKCVLTLVKRSIESIVEHSVTAGIAKRIMNATTSCAQTKIGIRFNDIPGARCVKMVVMMHTAEDIEAISTIVTICDHRSTRCTGENHGPQ